MYLVAERGRIVGVAYRRHPGTVSGGPRAGDRRRQPVPLTEEGTRWA